MSDLPALSKTYINHHLDSTRWEAYIPKNDDVIITTSYKSGTTLCQQILYNMLVRDTYDDEVFPNMDDVSPWVDSRYYPVPKQELANYLSGFSHRRFLKSHLPLDGLPYFDSVKYLIIARDPRDVFMSLLNHYAAYTEMMFEKVNKGVDVPMPRFNGDAKGFWNDWISRGWFEGELEGYPFWSNLYHTQTYWDYRHLPNFMFLHYADMRSDPAGAITRIAEFIEEDLPEPRLRQILKAVSFDHVKAQAVAESNASDDEGSFKGGQATFINKGTNGRWRDFLNDDDLEKYRVTRDKVLSPDCITWLERD